MSEAQTFGADFLTRVGFNKEQAAQWRGEWDQATEIIKEHGSKLAAKVILSPIGAAVFHGGADIPYRLGRLMDPRKTGNTDAISSLLSILGQRSGTLPPPEAALMYAAADFGHTVGYLFPVIITGVAVYQHRELFKGLLDAGSLAWARHQAGQIRKAEAGRQIPPEALTEFLNFQRQLDEQAGKNALRNSTQQFLSKPPELLK